MPSSTGPRQFRARTWVLALLAACAAAVIAARDLIQRVHALDAVASPGELRCGAEEMLHPLISHQWLVSGAAGVVGALALSLGLTSWRASRVVTVLAAAVILGLGMVASDLSWLCSSGEARPICEIIFYSAARRAGLSFGIVFFGLAVAWMGEIHGRRPRVIDRLAVFALAVVATDYVIVSSFDWAALQLAPASCVLPFANLRNVLRTASLGVRIACCIFIIATRIPSRNGST